MKSCFEYPTARSRAGTYPSADQIAGEVSVRSSSLVLQSQEKRSMLSRSSLKPQRSFVAAALLAGLIGFVGSIGHAQAQ